MIKYLNFYCVDIIYLVYIKITITVFHMIIHIYKNINLNIGFFKKNKFTNFLELLYSK